MRLTELHIDGFGIFTGYTLTGLQPGVNIIFGDNEAGKSTLLRFIRFTLFGYPRSVDQRLQPIRGGSHGGRVKLLLDDGTDVTLERTAGYPGDIQLHTAEAVSDSRDEWSRLLGHASAGLFENVYAISLDELVDLESLNRSGVEDRIFSIGLGLKNISINDIEQTLISRMEDIYKPRGTRQQVALLMHELEEHNREISAIQSHLPQYRELSRDIDRHRQQLRQVETELSERQSRYDRLSSYSKCYENFVIIRDADRELSTLPGWLEYPDNGPVRLERLEEEEARLQRELAVLQDDLAAVEAGGPVDYNKALAARLEEIEGLSLNLEKYKTCVEECREEISVLDGLNQSIRRRLAAIGADWAENRILAFTDTVAHQDRLEEFRRRLETLRHSRERLDNQISLLQARRSPIHARNACFLAAAVFLVAAAPLMVAGKYLWSIILLLVGLVLFSGRKLLTLEDPLKEAAQAVTWLEAEKARIIGEYQHYAGDELGLSPKLSPEAALESLRLIEGLGPDIIARDRHQARIEEKERFTRAFETKLAELARVMAGGAVETDKALLAARILREYKETVALKNRAMRRENDLAEKQEARRRAGQALSRVREQIDRLLASIQAADRNDFKKKYRDNSRVGGLLEQRRQALRTIEQIAGVHDRENVIAYLAATEKAVFEKELDELEQNLQTLRAARDEWHRKISADATRREQLRTSSDLAEVMTKKATCRENLDRCHRQWLAARLARHVVQQVKGQYEQKKQPAIIQNSSSFFREITGGRYQRIQVSLEDGRVLVFDESDAARRIDQLSRGTREQLLISIRLGFIEEYEKKTEPLPLVLDEVLVNFDRNRASHTAAILHDFSASRQTLLFTCHPQTRKLFRDLPVNLVNI